MSNRIKKITVITDVCKPRQILKIARGVVILKIKNKGTIYKLGSMFKKLTDFDVKLQILREYMTRK